MNGLVKIQEKDGQQLVSARDLYAFLGLSERFSSWAERNVKYGFVEGRDFTGVGVFTPVNNGAKIELQDYALTLDTAKQIAMMSRSDKGLQIREYFIECEKKLKEVQVTPALPMDYETALEALLKEVKAKKLAEEAQRLAELEAATQKALVQELAPAASYTQQVLKSTNFFNTTTVAKELEMSAQTLNKKLIEMKIVYFTGIYDDPYTNINLPTKQKIYHLYAPYQNKGFAQHETSDFIDPVTRKVYTKKTLVWSEKGIKWLHEKLNPNLNKAITTTK